MNAPSTAAFDESVRLLLELHALYVQGLDESSSADSIRDAMDEPWYSMTDEEQARIRQLSADLYTIGERHREATPAQSVVRSFEHSLLHADWRNLLDLLLNHPGLAEPDQRSSLRATAWAGLGVPAAASLFLEDARRARAHGTVAASRPLGAAAGSRRFPRYHQVEREAA